MIIPIYRLEKNGTESCFYVEFKPAMLQAELEKIRWLIAETDEPECTGLQSLLTGDFTEIGPRLTVETPQSSNAVSICQAMGLTQITRIERSIRYPQTNGATEASIIATHLDRMTQEVYREPVTSFETGIAPVETRNIPVLERGEDAIRAINGELGLGMDAWDFRFYTDLFTRMGRNPTDVELFQIGNANSEHCRHWFFRGKLVIDGIEMPRSLFDMVRAPLQTLEANGMSNSIVAFRDNAGVFKGHEVLTFVSEQPGRPARYVYQQGFWHITATAETHNHPTFVAPRPGAETGSGGRIRDNIAAGRGAVTMAGFGGYAVANLFIPGSLVSR